SYIICFSFFPDPIKWDIYFVKALLAVVITGISFYAFETYSGVIRYAGFRDILRIFVSLFCANIILYLIE
ncbi:MAG: hypothetical protein LIO93_07940, partial [Bacteroidales bacterium]|nr:hypothetical protein [Bacteroidales bacterium]